jgi:hypothetical protein
MAVFSRAWEVCPRDEDHGRQGRRTLITIGETMIRIAISQAAFDAVAATMPLGSVGYETEANAKGERLKSLWTGHAAARPLHDAGL